MGLQDIIGDIPQLFHPNSMLRCLTNHSVFVPGCDSQRIPRFRAGTGRHFVGTGSSADVAGVWMVHLRHGRVPLLRVSYDRRHESTDPVGGLVHTEPQQGVRDSRRSQLDRVLHRTVALHG